MGELSTAVRPRRSPPATGGVAGKRILLAEDDYFIVSDMARAFQRMGAKLIGPFATVAGVHEDSERPIDGAVLDINLRGELALDIADRLASDGVPFLFATAYDDSIIPDRFEAIVRCEKPVSPAKVARALFG